MSKKEMSGEYYGIEKADEERKLKRIRNLAKAQEEKMKNRVTSLKDELQELKEVYDLDEKEGLAQWFNTDARFTEVRRDLLRASRSLKKPYFGRIDIRDEENNRKETLYIGKSVIGPTPSEPEVIDWRAPISSVYYDHSLGKCKYTVPGEGIYPVTLDRKRTYEIDEDTLINFYDSDVVANDDLLTEYLSKSKRNVLSEIIATIQDEQNKVIRKNPHHNVLIQGSAGSGKTTVAMHRISYILYNYEREFKPEAFYIVGSNKVLLNYITGVLPDLDVYGVSQMTMEELFVKLLYEDWDRKKYKTRPVNKKDPSYTCKSTGEWFSELNCFAQRRLKNQIPKEDIVIEETGKSVFLYKDIEKEIDAHPEFTAFMLFEHLNNILQSKLESALFGKYFSYNSEEQKKIFHRFNNYFFKFVYKKSVFDLYDEFVRESISRGRAVSYTDKEPDLYDLAALAYLYKKIKETEVIQEAGHVVIDEAQDFGMAVYHSLKYCMSKCTFTIMGDVAQNINFSLGLSDWEELKKVMLPDRYDYFGLLKKSYRNTVEISEYATNILYHGSFPVYPVEPIIRHGESVYEAKCDSFDDICKAVSQKAAEYKEKGYETIAIICKDADESQRAIKKLDKDCNAKMFSKDQSEFGNGVWLIPIEYAKGLEFDAVIVFDASKDAYPKNDNYAKLLYVAVTRSLHELAVFYEKELTHLITDPVSEERINQKFDADNYHLEPIVFEEEFKSKEEKAKEQTLLGDLIMKDREKFGPERIVVKPLGQQKQSTLQKTKAETKILFSKDSKKQSDAQAVMVKKKSTEFGTMPEGTSLHPAGHGTIDTSVKWVNAGNKSVDITSNYGTLTITPLGPETVRIEFGSDENNAKCALPQEIECKETKFKCAKTREYVEITLPKLMVKVSLKTGAVSFHSAQIGCLLSEKETLTRQIASNVGSCYEYFDFGKREILKYRGMEDSDWKDLGNSAYYISHGKESDRPSLIMSNKRYQIMVPAGIKVLACNIQTYGPYVCFENSKCIDYIFRTM